MKLLLLLLLGTLIPIARKTKYAWLISLTTGAALLILLFSSRDYLYNLIGIYNYSKGTSGHELNYDYIDKAESYFKKAIGVNSSFAQAYANLGIMTTLEGSQEAFELGQEYFDKAIYYSPRCLEIYLLAFQHVLFFAELDANIDLTLADSLIGKALTISTKPDPNILVHKGRYCASYFGEYNKAISILRRATIKKSPFSQEIVPDFHNWLLIDYNLHLLDQLSDIAASVYFDRFMDTGAVIPPIDSLEWIPRKDNFYNRIADEFIERENFSMAKEYLELSLSVNPENKWALKNCGDLYYFTKNFEKSIEYYKKALQYGYDGVVYARLASCYQKRKEYVNAIDALEDAIKSNFPEGAGYYNIAANYALLHKKQMMLDYLSKAIEIDNEFRIYSRSDSLFKEYWRDKEYLILTSK